MSCGDGVLVGARIEQLLDSGQIGTDRFDRLLILCNLFLFRRPLISKEIVQIVEGVTYSTLEIEPDILDLVKFLLA